MRLRSSEQKTIFELVLVRFWWNTLLSYYGLFVVVIGSHFDGHNAELMRGHKKGLDDIATIGNSHNQKTILKEATSLEYCVMRTHPLNFILF